MQDFACIFEVSTYAMALQRSVYATKQLHTLLNTSPTLPKITILELALHLWHPELWSIVARLAEQVAEDENDDVADTPSIASIKNKIAKPNLT